MTYIHLPNPSRVNKGYHFHFWALKMLPRFLKFGRNSVV